MKATTVSLDAASDRELYGGKAANLALMLQSGLPVPNGFAVGLSAFNAKGQLRPGVKEQISRLIDNKTLYAVRSSALAEDSKNASWAGQFETFLNTESSLVIEKVEVCHNSVKQRVRAYGSDKSISGQFHVAVIVQEMVDPSYAGLAFTKDPSSGANQILIEYVPGLGEPLVHGDVDPERVVWGRSRRQVKEQTEQDLPIPLGELIALCEEVERVFEGVPQDIEWAFDGKRIWLVQSRPITSLQDRGVGKHYLGEPGNLFYWGPSRATPLFMSDFIRAAAKFFAHTVEERSLPAAPKTLVLFHDSKVVWLIKAKAFSEFVDGMFRVYESQHELNADRQAWQAAILRLDQYFAEHKEIDLLKVAQLFEEAWWPTLMPEFSLYGAEAVIHEWLARFDEKQQQEIWGGMTLPDQSTFMQRVDNELVRSGEPAQLANEYPWIQNGYYGAVADATSYFSERLKIVRNNVVTEGGTKERREEIVRKFELKKNEIKALDLARELSVFMDDRKAWMMRSRSYIRQVEELVISKFTINSSQANDTTLESLARGDAQPYFGSSFMEGKTIELDAEDVALAWDWYVEFRASHAVLRGIVASSAGRHFINGVVFVAQTPQDAMPDESLLVVPSTSPSYVPLMRKARALVTDHGGMMSHAAIVAREFGLPCIIGTKRATRILKTGDKVVLDLVKGEVNR